MVFGIAIVGTFSHWIKCKRNSSLALHKWHWAMLINKHAEKWRSMLEKDLDTTYARHWIGFFIVSKEGISPYLVATPTHLPYHCRFNAIHGSLMNRINQLEKLMVFFMKLESFIPLEAQ